MAPPRYAARAGQSADAARRAAASVPRADFSGITRAEKPSISKVIHQANIDVDENGTTAAAATAVGLRAVGRSLDVVTVHVDRPFVFLVRDVRTGAILLWAG